MKIKYKVKLRRGGAVVGLGELCYLLIMKILRFMVLVFLATPVWAMAPQDEPVVKVVEKVRPAVVNIYTERIVEQQVVDPITDCP